MHSGWIEQGMAVGCQTRWDVVGCGGKVVVGRQNTMMWQQSQCCLVIFRNVLGGMVYEV